MAENRDGRNRAQHDAGRQGDGELAERPDSMKADEQVAGSAEVVRVEAFDPAEVRPWRFHNRTGSGMDDVSLDGLADSIRRDGQQQLGLARRLPPGGEHKVEAIFGVRRLEACRRAGVLWRAEVRDSTLTDAECAALMHGENEWTEGVAPLENALQWKAMLDAGVFENQSALAAEIGCHRGTVSRAVRTATALFGEEWIERHVRPVMHEFTGRSADRLADALAAPGRLVSAMGRAKQIVPGTVPAEALYEALLGARRSLSQRETVFLRPRRARGGGAAAKIERDGAGGFLVEVKPHTQTPEELAELAEQIESLVAGETSAAAGVRLGRRVAASLGPETVKEVERSWLEGCIWALARGTGLDWDRWRCASAVDLLRNQEGGWEQSVVRAVGGRDADPSGGRGRETDG